MQTALRSSLMTKVSPRCGCGSALECQLGTLRDVELGESDWHSKHLRFLCGHVHSAACASWCGAPWNILQWGCGWRQVMQEGEFHCHAFPKEKKSLNLGGASCSISSRNLQLVPRQPSQMCVALSRRTVLPLFPLSFCYIFPHSTTRSINQILAQLGRRAYRNHHTPLRDIVQGDSVIKGCLLNTHAQKQVQSKKTTKILEEPPVMLWSELGSVKFDFIPRLCVSHQATNFQKEIKDNFAN